MENDQKMKKDGTIFWGVCFWSVFLVITFNSKRLNFLCICLELVLDRVKILIKIYFCAISNFFSILTIVITLRPFLQRLIF